MFRCLLCTMSRVDSRLGQEEILQTHVKYIVLLFLIKRLIFHILAHFLQIFWCQNFPNSGVFCLFVLNLLEVTFWQSGKHPDSRLRVTPGLCVCSSFSPFSYLSSSSKSPSTCGSGTGSFPVFESKFSILSLIFCKCSVNSLLWFVPFLHQQFVTDNWTGRKRCFLSLEDKLQRSSCVYACHWSLWWNWMNFL